MFTWQPSEVLASWASALPPDSVHDSREAGPLRGYRELWCDLASAAGRAGDRASVARLGASVGGEPLWAVALDHRREPGRSATTLVVAGLHAMEHIGPAVIGRLFERAVDAPERWPEQRLVVMPLVNPDGFRDVCADLATGRRRFRRVNRRGVDLNRNFAHHASASSGIVGRVARRFFEPGSHPLSEPESAALDRLARAEQPRYAVSLHAFGRWIYIPWAGSRARPEALAAHQHLAERMVSRQSSPYRVVSLGRRSRFFLAHGTELDHFHAAGALSFLVEIGSGPSLFRPRGWFSPYRWYTPTASKAEHEIRNVIPAIESLGENRGTNGAPKAS